MPPKITICPPGKASGLEPETIGDLFVRQFGQPDTFAAIQRRKGIVTLAGKSYRVHGGNTATPAIYSLIPRSTGWRQTPPHERRLKSTSPLFARVLAEWRKS